MYGLLDDKYQPSMGHLTLTSFTWFTDFVILLSSYHD